MELYIVEATGYDWDSREEFHTINYFSNYSAALETFNRKKGTPCFVKVKLDKYTDTRIKDGEYRIHCTMNSYGC